MSADANSKEVSFKDDSQRCQMPGSRTSSPCIRSTLRRRPCRQEVVRTKYTADGFEPGGLIQPVLSELGCAEEVHSGRGVVLPDAHDHLKAELIGHISLLAIAPQAASENCVEATFRTVDAHYHLPKTLDVCALPLILPLAARSNARWLGRWLACWPSLSLSLPLSLSLSSLFQACAL